MQPKKEKEKRVQRITGCVTGDYISFKNYISTYVKESFILFNE